MKAPIATCSVTDYGGLFAGHNASLKAFRTFQAGQFVIRYRWVSDSGNAYEIPGIYAHPKTAIIVAQRNPRCRDVKVM